jgi:hypothetical protein
MILPTAEDFRRNSWLELESLTDDEDLAVEQGEMSPSLRKRVIYDCDTHACLVGWGALAMGEGGVDPDEIKNPATAEFLLGVVQRLGFDLADTIGRRRVWASQIYATLTAISDAFEGVLTPNAPSYETVAAAWEAEASARGYDVDNAREI